MDYITLMGTEEIKKAGSRMHSAAETMLQASSQFEESLSRHRQFLDEWLERLARVLNESGNRP